LFFRDRGSTEVGGFGLSRPDDLLYVEDFVTVRQVASPIGVEFDDAAVADYFDRQVDAGLRPDQFARIWIHSHPSNCAYPSGTDIRTFERAFGGCHWSVMFILARGGQTSARLHFNVGPGGSMLIPVRVDYDHPFDGTNREDWQAEYEQNVHPDPCAALHCLTIGDLVSDDAATEDPTGLDDPSHLVRGGLSAPFADWDAFDEATDDFIDDESEVL
jgi:hypothetical protein